MFSILKKVIYETEFEAKLAIQQCLVRNFLHILVVVITLIAQYFGGIGTLDDAVVTFGILYIVISAAATALLYRYHSLSRIISITGVVTDTAIICFIMYMGADREASLYGLLLFLVIANGLRFGKSHMQFANMVCLTGFLLVIGFNEFWKAHVLMSVGNVIWLILIPAHMKNLLTNLEAAVEKAESANMAKSLFIANMSHEIRTPLTSIIGFGRALLNKNRSAEETEIAVSSIVRNGEHLSSVVNDILDISKIEAGKVEINSSDINLIDVLTEVDFFFRNKIESKGLKFNINYHWPLPETIFSDSLRLKQILINMCSNAYKFTKEGGISVDVSFNEKKDEIFISVKDTGIGLSKDQRDEVFMNFSQADVSTTRNYGGTGLGLPISRKLAELMGGKLWVDSEVGEGSIFSFTVSAGKKTDYRLLHEMPDLDNKSQINEQYLIQVTGNILLVDDVADNQVLMRTLLEDMGATVDIAENGKVAVEAVNDNNYDLVLLDLQMPVMGGKEALSIMRESGDKTPIVFLTANVIQNEEKESKNCDCQGFLSKPVDEKKLQEVVSQFLKVTGKQIIEQQFQSSQSNDVIVSRLVTDNNKSGVYGELAKVFSEQLKARINEIEEANKVEDYVLLADLVHNLKGLGGNMGYDILTTLSEQVEKLIRENNYSDIKYLIDELHQAEYKIIAAFSR